MRITGTNGNYKDLIGFALMSAIISIAALVFTVRIFILAK